MALHIVSVNYYLCAKRKRTTLNSSSFSVIKKCNKFIAKCDKIKLVMYMKLGIYCAGAVGIQIKEIAESQGAWSEIIFIDDGISGKTFRGFELLSFSTFCKKYDSSSVEVVIGAGDPKLRKKLCDKVIAKGYKLASVIHPYSYISSDAKIGEGVVVEMGSYIGFDTEIGDNNLISAGSIIAHNCKLLPHSVFLGTTIAGGCNIGEASLLGMGCVIRERTNVGNSALVSMGAMVFSDVPDNMIVMGNPARVIGENKGRDVYK